MTGSGKHLRHWALGLTACAGVALAGRAARAESFYLVEGDGKAMNLVDMDSIKRSGDLARVTQAVAYAGMPDDKIYTARITLEFNCKEGKVHTLSAASFGLDDAALATASAPGDWQDAAAGSLLAKYSRFACGKARPDPAGAMDDKLPALARSYRKAIASGSVK